MPRPRALPVLALLALPAVLAAEPRLTVDPPVALADEAVRIRVTGLRSNGEVRLRASTVDADGAGWRSEAVFHADRKGTVDVARQAPVSGSYAGVDPMGLFWSMRRDALVPGGTAPRAPVPDLMIPPDGPQFAHGASGSVDVTLEAVLGETVAASAPAVRLWTRPDVTVTAVAEDGLVGRLYEPAGGRHPAILVLGGSNGGILATHAQLLASHGYATLALAYFRAPGLPKDLMEIPLEYFKGALDRLRARPSVDPGRIGVLGISRGAELALLLAATYPELKAVVAISPSDRVWEAALRDPAKTGIAALKADRTSWTLAGKPLPFMPKTVSPELRARLERGERFTAIEMMDTNGADADTVARAAIPVERIGGPVLLLSGGADRMWPSAGMAAAVERRLAAARFPHRVESLFYPEAGHMFADSWMPVAYGGAIGGSARANARAFADYWPRLQAFLKSSLGRPAPR